MRRILFYKLPISKLDFVQNIIPPLKDSLSHALKHYTPLAGNVACPLDTNGYPEIRYVTGDSVSLIFSESDMDFSYLISDHPRSAKDFYHLVPKLGEPKDAPGIRLAPLLAIQVTLFPNNGVSIGFTNHHVVGDGATIVALLGHGLYSTNLVDMNNSYRMSLFHFMIGLYSKIHMDKARPYGKK